MNLTSIAKPLLIAGAALALPGWWLRSALPGPDAVLDSMMAEPIQEEIAAPEDRVIEAGGMAYTVSPKFHYVLHGMVVSQHDARVWYDYYHSRWKDMINVKDICVAWGANLSTGIYEKVDFSSGSWTCWCQLKRGVPHAEWANFRMDQVSNNHLLPANERAHRAIMSARTGDQIRLSGYLAEYSHRGGAFRRGTSTRRDDTGNGACETILVEEFEILRPANRVWHALYAAGLSLAAAGLAAWIIGYWRESGREAREFAALQTYDVLGRPE